MIDWVGHIAAWAGVLVGVAAGGEPPLELRDPAVPKVHALPSSAPAAQPRRHPRGRLLGKPRPLAAGAVTSDWAAFLGPTHNAVSPETKLLKDFSPAPGGAARPTLLWYVTKGQGYAGPAVVGERLVLIHRLRNEEVVECLHAERGELYWEYRYPTNYRDRYNYDGGPRASPVISGGRVYTFGVQGKLHCLDLRTGHLYWKRDLAKEFKMRRSFFGVGSTPLVEGGLLILSIGGEGGPSVIALDAKTGRLAWGAEKAWGAGYASPVPATIHGKRVVLVFAGGESDPPTGGLICLDPNTGRTHFRFPWRSRRVESVNASSPVVTGDLVFISSIYDVGGAMLRVGPELTHTVAYPTKDFSAHWMTPIVVGEYLYGFSDATLVCMALKTGKVLWSVKPLTGPASGGSKTVSRPPLGRASMIRADGAFLCLGEYGDLCWLDLSPEGMKVMTKTKLFHAPQTWTCPVLSKGLLYVCQNYRDLRTGRGTGRLLCYDLRAAR